MHTEAYHTPVSRLPNRASNDAAGLFGAADAAAERPLTVTELSARISDALFRGLARQLRVVGEVSGMKARGGHWYFEFKDQGAVLNCAMWQSYARQQKTQPVDGESLLLTGRVEHYGPFGKTQFIVESFTRVGQGELDAQFQRLCAELKALGYFEPARKKPVPAFPRRIAIVTSLTGAVVHDCVRISGQRLPSLPLLLVDVPVQGSGAAAQIAAAIASLDTRSPQLGVDVILLARGGGSREDLWAFNERPIADAIFKCRTPIVTAIGHEKDHSVADMVADRSYPTPSGAMEQLVPDGAALDDELKHLQARMSQGLRRNVSDFKQSTAMRQQLLTAAMRTRLERGRARASAAAEAVARISPVALLGGARERLAGLTQRMITAIGNRITLRQNTLVATERHLRAISHHEVLKRGYAVLQRADGGVVSSVSAARAGDQLAALVSDGAIPVEVLDASTPHASEADSGGV